MAYMNQTTKQSKAPAIRAILKKYGLSGSLSVLNHSTLVLTIKSGRIDFIQNYNRVATNDGQRNVFFRQPVTSGYIQVNPFWYHEHFDGAAKQCLAELVHAMNAGNYDRSNPQFDHFDVGWYIKITVGKWDKPYQVVGA